MSHDLSGGKEQQVAHDFLGSGMGLKFSKLQYYNSLKYSKQSPLGRQVQHITSKLMESLELQNGGGGADKGKEERGSVSSNRPKSVVQAKRASPCKDNKG